MFTQFRAKLLKKARKGKKTGKNPKEVIFFFNCCCKYEYFYYLCHT